MKAEVKITEQDVDKVFNNNFNFTDEEIKKMNLHEKLLCMQQEINVPKGKYNSFGNFWYRSCEDILVAIKPLLLKYRVILELTDKPVVVGNYVYIEATAILTSTDTCVNISCTASARESDVKKGMDASQLTGTASSYARKYALNGLLLLDDVKDADTDEYKVQQDEKAGSVKINAIKEVKQIMSTEKQQEMIKKLYEKDVNELVNKLALLNKKKISELTIQEASKLIQEKKEG